MSRNTRSRRLTQPNGTVFSRQSDSALPLVSLLAQSADGDKQLPGFLRREHGGRLIEDQQADVAPEGLENFHALLLADR